MQIGWHLSKTIHGNALPIVLRHSTNLQSKWASYSKIKVPCVEQGVSLKNSLFELNKAGLDGGAIATPDKFKNAFFQLENITFIINSTFFV